MNKLLNHPYHLLLIALAYLVGLWAYCVPFTGDQKVYLSTAMEMRQAGEWIYPTLFGQHSYYKPPLQYWATLAGWSVFGFSLLGAFLPSVLAVIGTAWALGEIKKTFIPTGSASSNTAGLWFAGAAGTVTYGTTAQMEIWIVLFYFCAWWAALRFFKSGRSAFLYLALILAGLLALVKSPLYSVFWVLSFWAYALLTRNWRVFFSPHFLLSHLLGATVGASWYVHVFRTDRERFWNEYVVRETLSKRTGNLSTIPHVWADFASFCLPFLLLLIPAALAFLTRGLVWRQRLIFIACAVALPIAFFMVFPFRTETYLYIALPAIALLLDWGLDAIGEGRFLARWISRINGVLIWTVTITVAGLLLVAGFIGIGAALALLAGALAFLWFSWKGKWKQVAAASLALAMVFRLAGISLGENDIAGLRAIAAEQQHRVVSFFDDGHHIWHEVGLLSAAIGKPSPRVPSLEDLPAALRRGEMVVLNDEQWKRAKSYLMEALGPGSLPRLREKSWWRWKRGFELPSWDDIRTMTDRTTDTYRQKYQREFKVFWLDQGP